MKTLIPWVLVVALLAGVYFVYSDSKLKDARLAAAQKDAEEVVSLRSEVEDLRKVAVQTNEIARLRKDSEDLLRLRSEVNQLRSAGQQLSNQLKTAQTQTAQAQAQVTQAQAQQQQMSQQLQQQAAAAQVQAATQAQAQTQTAAQAQAAACINNLRQIEGAKQTWALENKKTAASIPTAADIAPYLRGGVFNLACPAGGTYTLNGLTAVPTCSIPGHALQ
jgi:flagellar biosynthesis GTPase FlhF